MKIYEVNTVKNNDGEIITSNSFLDLESATSFYNSIDNNEKKELLVYDDGYMIEEIACNYGH
jgi:hypothetical protein